jgi:hypothetical protein
MEGNPIGTVGLALLMKAKTKNMNDFQIKIRLAEGESDSAADGRFKLFDREKSEGVYALNLALTYDQFVLQELLTISSEVSRKSIENGAPIEQKACFYQVKLDGKPKWEVPTAKTPEGLWDLGLEPKGILVFTFTHDPAEYKKELLKLTREAAPTDPKAPPVDTSKLRPQAKEVITEQQVSWPVATSQEFEHYLKILL